MSLKVKPKEALISYLTGGFFIKPKIMSANIITTEDLEEFKITLLNEIKQLLIDHEKIGIGHWIKSSEVIQKLEISPGTLQNFRLNGTIPFTKLGGIIFYDEERINEILRSNEVNFKRNAA